MRILVVGGTGMIGAHAANHLAREGHAVTVAARKPPQPATAASAYSVLLGDYSAGGLTVDELAGFDAVLFAAGNDIRHLPKDVDRDDFWRRTQIEGVPDFVERARRAGVRRLVQLGSYYHQVMPELIARDDYVRARSLADEGARSLASPDFNVSTLNPPSIVGVMPGVAARRYETLVAWARGERPDIPDFAPAGGTNYMSVRSLCEAISGALRSALSGKAYLVGDENLTFTQFFQTIFDVVGAGRMLVERDEEHPILPDAFIVPGRGRVLAYEPPEDETALLGYRRHDVRRAVEEIVASLPSR